MLRDRLGGRFVCAAVAAIAGWALCAALSGASASAAPVPVYGSPGYTTGVGGYRAELLPPGADVNDAGTAVGFANRYDAANNSKGIAAFRWSSAGAVELGNLGTSSTGSMLSQTTALNAAGTAVGV